LRQSFSQSLWEKEEISEKEITESCIRRRDQAKREEGGRGKKNEKMKIRKNDSVNQTGEKDSEQQRRLANFAGKSLRGEEIEEDERRRIGLGQESFEQMLIFDFQHDFVSRQEIQLDWVGKFHERSNRGTTVRESRELGDRERLIQIDSAITLPLEGDECPD
jgi:hypothetical protein